MKALSKKMSGRIITKLLTFAISDWGNSSGYFIHGHMLRMLLVVVRSEDYN